MAKPKDTPLFQEPEFDEKEYLTSEKERARAVILIFFIGAVSGLIAGYLQLQGYVVFSVLLMIAILVFLSKIVGFFGIRVSERTSHKVINSAVFILTWLVFWIIFLNPPLNTVSAPQISTPQIQTSSDHWTNLTASSSNIYNGQIGSHSYRVDLTYRYPVNVTDFTWHSTGGGSSGKLHYAFHNDYIYFNYTGSVNLEIIFQVYWTSQNISPTQPLTFEMVF